MPESQGDVDITHKSAPAINILFSEEVGWILEVDEKYRDEVMEMFQRYKAPACLIGKSAGFGMNSEVIINMGGSWRGQVYVPRGNSKIS